jgi:hypothetical protein
MSTGLNLGTLSVTLGAILTKFNKDMDQARGKVASVATAMRGMVNTAGKVAAAAAIAGAAITASLVRAGLESVGVQARLARSVNGTVNGMRALTEAGEELGIEAEEIAAALGILNARLGEAERTGSPAAKMLEALGLRARDLAKLDVDQRLAAIADRVQALGLSTAQTADLTRQLGIRSKEMAILLMQGGDAIRGARDQVDKLGLSISDVDAAQVEAAQAAMRDIGDTLENVRDQIAIALAPLVTELASRFNQTAAEAGGFRTQALSAVETTLRGFAKVADVIRGLHVVFKGLQLVVAGFGSAVTSVLQVAAEGIVAWVDVAIDGINGLIGALNKIPKVDIAKVDPWTNSEFMKGMRAWGEESRDHVTSLRDELSTLVHMDMPSAKVEDFLKAVRDRAAEAAASVVAARQEMQGIGGAEGFAADEDEEAKRAAEEAKKREQERMIAEQQGRLDRITALREHLATESELEIQAHYARLGALEEMSAAELEQIGGFQAAKEQLEQQHMERLQEIREAGMTELEKFQAMSWDRQLSTVAGSIMQMTSGVAAGNKKMFELHKAASLAQAVVSLPAAIIDSYKNAGGWPLGATAAAAMAAAGAAQIQQIKNAKFGGGGGSAPAAASGGSGGAGGGGGGRQALSITGLSPDSLFSGSMVRALLERIQGALDDGATLVLDN